MKTRVQKEKETGAKLVTLSEIPHSADEIAAFPAELMPLVFERAASHLVAHTLSTKARAEKKEVKTTLEKALRDLMTGAGRKPTEADKAKAKDMLEQVQADAKPFLANCAKYGFEVPTKWTEEACAEYQQAKRLWQKAQDEANLA